jgi:hypothetical protein
MVKIEQEGAHTRIVFVLVGTSRCDVPARAERAERMSNVHADGCAAERGADGAARRPYQEQCVDAPATKTWNIFCWN